MSTVEERVAKGAALLDAHKADWVNDIDLPGLNLKQQGTCILGQEFGWYARGALALGLGPWSGDAIDHGFLANEVDAYADLEAWEAEDQEWADLQAAWVALIEERLNGDR